MKHLKLMLIIILVCVGSQSVAQDPHAESGLMKGIVQEVLQVSSYTYLNVLEEDGNKRWLAVPTIDAKLGEIYYFKGGMEMPDFKSTELDRTFDSVLFLSAITNADLINAETGKINSELTGEVQNSKQATLDKLDLIIPEIDKGIRIAELFGNKEQYEGKKVKIHGEVTKFSVDIMGKNWVHFQDGTQFEGAYDLMITCLEVLVVGDVVTFEGIIALDKDFGAGYFYNIIMEEAVLVK